MRKFTYNPDEDNDFELRDERELVVSVGHIYWVDEIAPSIYLAGQYWSAYLYPDEADQLADELHRRAEIARSVGYATRDPESEDGTDADPGADAG